MILSVILSVISHSWSQGGDTHWCHQLCSSRWCQLLCSWPRLNLPLTLSSECWSHRSQNLEPPPPAAGPAWPPNSSLHLWWADHLQLGLKQYLELNEKKIKYNYFYHWWQSWELKYKACHCSHALCLPGLVLLRAWPCWVEPWHTMTHCHHWQLAATAHSATCHMLHPSVSIFNSSHLKITVLDRKKIYTKSKIYIDRPLKVQ